MPWNIRAQDCDLAIMSARIKIAIRADAGQALGTGHFARAAAVAEVLLESGSAGLVLATSTEGAELAPAFFSSQVKVLSLAQGSTSPEATMQALRVQGWAPDAILLDQYGEVPQWEAVAVANGINLLVIDDLDAAERADIIVRPHGGPKYDGKSTVLRGPPYLPLSSHVTACTPIGHTSLKSGERLRLNVCFGGSDPTDETTKAIAALAELSHIDVDVVIGPRTQIPIDAIEAVHNMPHVKLHRAPTQAELATLIASADLALGAGGVMLWERMYLAIPSLIISIADNQNAQIASMTDAGAIRFLGDYSAVSSADIRDSVLELAADENERSNLAKVSMNLVDGKGAQRVAEYILSLAQNRKVS